MRRFFVPLHQFSDLLQQAPLLASRLLAEEGLAPSGELLTQLRKYYVHLDVRDYYSFERTGRFTPEREGELLLTSGLPPPLSGLPPALHRRYQDNISREYDQHGTYKMSDEEVIFSLTGGGCIPLRSMFVIKYVPPYGVRYLVYSWWPSGGLGYLNYEVEDEQDQCSKYLISRGASFDSEEEVFEHARLAEWPHAEEAEAAYKASQGPE